MIQVGSEVALYHKNEGGSLVTAFWASQVSEEGTLRVGYLVGTT